MKPNLFLSGIAASTLVAVPAFAQEALGLQAPPPAAADPASTPAEAIQVQLGDIVVTAQRRSERLQEVPIAITAATSSQLVRKGVSDAFDIGKITPSFSSARVVGFGTPIMRGVGTTNVTAGDEPSVATYIDGFYQGTPATIGIPFNNLERLEVLKGPQGTLYGRNATGGLVSYITRAPSTGKTAIEANAGYANYETVTADGYVNLPVSSNVAVNVATTFRHQGTGFYRNILDGTRLGTDNYFAIRGKLLFEFGANDSLTIGGSYAHLRDNRANVNIPEPGTTPLTTGPGVIYATKPFDWAGSLIPRFTVKAWDVNATLKLDLGFANFTSLSQYKEYRNVNIVEGDGTTADGILAGTQLGITPGLPQGSPLTPQAVIPYTLSYLSKERLPYFFTQELQLSSKPGGPLSWIVGGFFQASKEGYDPLTISYEVGSDFTTIRADQTTRAYAGFAQATYGFGGGWSLTGGARYSSETKHVFGTTVVPAFGLNSSADQEKTFNSFTYRVALDYKPMKGLLIYATANKGFKSGTFVTNTPDAPAVKPEILYAYEAGFKADPASFVRINMSGYYYKYKDIQTFINTPAGLSFLQNAASARMYGFEASLDVLPYDGLSLSMGLGYENARYQKFQNAQAWIPSPSGGNYTAALDVSGNAVLRTPDLTANGAITYEFAVGDGKVALNSSVSYSGKFYWDAANLFVQDEYTLVDLSAKYTAPGQRWSMTLWGKNVTDVKYGIYLNPQQRFSAISYGDPATYGMTLGIKF